MSTRTAIARFLGFSGNASPPSSRRLLEPSAILPAAGPRNQVEFTDVPSSDAVRMGQIFAVDSGTGVPVTEQTSMRVSAVYACVRLIAGAIASMPLNLFKRSTQDQTRQRAVHPYWSLLNEQPTARFIAATFWEFIATQILLRGDGYAYIDRDRNGRIKQLIPMRWEQVLAKREGDQIVYYIGDDDRRWGAEQSDVLHFPGLGFGLTWDSVHGMSVIGWAARQAIGIAIQADRFAGQFYGQGAHPEHVITTKDRMSDEQKQRLKDAWVEKYSGTGYTGVPLVLTEGLDVKAITMNASDAQFLESRKFQVVDIARAFGVPPHMIGDTEKTSSWGSGIESLSLSFILYTLAPHMARIKQEVTRKLWPTGPLFADYDVSALLRGDLKTRGDYFRQAIGGSQGPGWMSPNEVRAHDDLPPIAGGDQLYDPKKVTNAKDTAQPQAA